MALQELFNMHEECSTAIRYSQPPPNVQLFIEKTSNSSLKEVSLILQTKWSCNKKILILYDPVVENKSARCALLDILSKDLMHTNANYCRNHPNLLSS